MSTVPPAPVPADELARALAPFGSSRLLPRTAYVDEAVLTWEREYVFGGWVAVGRSEDVPTAGARAESVGDYGLLMMRDKTGALRGFENACRHRGHELLPCGVSTTAKRAIVCPYHAWSYLPDGSLCGAPGFNDLEGFDRSSFSLRPVEVREWHGWVFADRSGRGGSFDDHVGDLEEVVTRYDGAGLVTPVAHEYDVAANWKVIVENYQECYHCSMIHPELCRVSPPSSGENLQREGDWVGGWMDLRPDAETMSLDGRSGSVAMAQLDDAEKRTVMYVAVLPNLLISLHPDYVMTHLLTPLAPNRTRIRCSWAFPAQAVAAEDFDPSYAVDFWDLTNKQDWGACESVQRGIATPGFVPGPLAPEEDGVYQFVTMMARRYQGESE